MNFNTRTFTQVIEKALAQCGDRKRWQNAVRKAAEGLKNGSIIVTETVAGALVTTEGGSYRVNGKTCECPAGQYGNAPCKHRAARRLVALYNAAPVQVVEESPRETWRPNFIETKTIESDWRGNRHVVTRYNGWMV